MEKNYNCLLYVPYQRMIDKIKVATRNKAATLEEFKTNRNGCIRITMVPLSILAEAWLGGRLSNFQPFDTKHVHLGITDVCEREFVFKLFPEGTHTMQFVCEDKHTEPVNCYGYSALKVAFASWKRKFDEWAKKDEIPEDLEAHEYAKQTQYFVAENGYSLDEGVVYTTILLDGTPFMRLYVTVSGAQTGKVDLECASEGMRAGQEFLKEINSNMMFELSEELNFTCDPDFVMM